MKNEESIEKKGGMGKHKLFHSVLFILLLAGLLVGVRLFVAESVHLSTDAMETTLHRGDFVLAHKFPFQIGKARNGIFLYTSPLRQDSLAAPLLVGRCIGMPGDTIEVEPDCYRINGEEYPRSPNTLNTYYIPREAQEELISVMKRLRIPERDLSLQTNGCTLRLTPFEEYQVREELPASLRDVWKVQPVPAYQLVIPRKGRAYRLDSLSLFACRDALLRETQGKAVFREGRMYLEGKQTDFFFFTEDYYWFLSDNVAEGIDSRHVGIVPASHIMGKLFFCWYSKDPNIRFKHIQ